QIDYYRGSWVADGKVCLDLHGSPGYGGVKQTFATEKGKRYRVTFALSAASGYGLQRIAVEAAGERVTFESDGGKNKKANCVWSTKTLDFTATGAKTTLEIYTLETKRNPDAGPLLDNVAVVLLPK